MKYVTGGEISAHVISTPLEDGPQQKSCIHDRYLSIALPTHSTAELVYDERSNVVPVSGPLRIIFFPIQVRTVFLHHRKLTAGKNLGPAKPFATTL